MVLYKCLRCKYESGLKNNFMRHIRRHKLCVYTKEDVSQEYIYEFYFGNKIKESIIDPKESKKEYICNFCEKIYSNNSNLYKHHKICKEKKKDDECKNDMIELVQKLNDQLIEKDKQYEKQLEAKDKQINELIKKTGINIGTQNIQNNIKILAYKNTDISHLTDMRRAA
jgi:hypothetical protein